eukprot:TRINITY_DN263_c0_g1_i1.p1 TRINITY_DN263_c0_g1~~TRINITY_DN263_c0_g1_i1.p1  ORF type:complete len:1381 (+),score=494.77 TRINITY_DN263_c0_g1_i1:55-4197(+)
MPDGKPTPRNETAGYTDSAQFAHYWLGEPYFAEQPDVDNHGKDELGNPVPRNTAPSSTRNPFSILTLWWATNMIAVGYRRSLQHADLLLVPFKLGSMVVNQQLESAWQLERELRGETASLPRAIVRHLRWRLVAIGALFPPYIATTFANPIMQTYYIQYVNDPSISIGMGFVYVAITLVAFMIGSVGQQMSTWIALQTAIWIRNGLMMSVFNKALLLSAAAFQKSSSGQIVTLMSNDAQSVMESAQFIAVGVLAPLQVIGVMVFLGFILGPYCLITLFVFLALVPLQIKVAKGLMEARRSMLKFTDERTKLTNEIFQAIRILKFYSWERFYSDRLLGCRNKELVFVRKTMRLRMMIGVVMTGSTVIASVLTFVIMAAAGEELTPLNVFPAVTLINAMSRPFNILPIIIALLTSLNVSWTRIQKFLELESLVTDTTASEKDDKDMSVSITGGNCTWGDEKAEPTLRDIDFKIDAGKLLMIIGSVGAGKSSMLSALLGEMRVQTGKIHITRSSIAYVPQQAWMMNASLRDNILFGQPYEEKRYKQILDACALGADLLQLPAGDLTEIGDRGINLSGGQKQRVSIARALYSDRQVYLFDDPLSALDAHVGKHIFDHVFSGLLKNRTRILVTNQLQYLPSADLILVMNNGKISERGDYRELSTGGVDFQELMKNVGIYEEDVAEAEAEQLKRQALKTSLALKVSTGVGKDEHTPSRKSSVSKKTDADLTKLGRLTEDEERMRGSSGLEAYTFWFRAGGGVTSFFVALLLFSLYWLIGQAGSDWWLSSWSSMMFPGHPVTFYLGIYIGWSVFSLIFNFFSSIFLVQVACLACKSIFEGLLARMLRAPTWFYDVTPVGRILNRFSKDQDMVDNQLGNQFTLYFRTTFNVLATILIIGYASWYVLVVIVPAGVIYIFLQQFYMRNAREVQRLDALSKSPIFQQFTSLLAGLNTIRAYQREKMFLDANHKAVEHNTRAVYSMAAANIWISTRLDWVSVLVITATCISVVVFRGTWSAGTVGLALSYAFNAAALLTMTVKTAAETEIKMNSVERISFYSDNVPQEAADEVEGDDNLETSGWPQKGRVEFRNVRMRYRPDLDDVIKGVSFTIEPGEKIGVCGRTGAGKSTMLTLLFRHTEVSSGQILIDGVDISKIGLHVLRSKIAMIPQDPVLFTGTVRSNLDPFSQYSDTAIWDSLGMVSLKEFISSLPLQLAERVQENGENFSTGQRQLICLARALLRKPKILLMDEATASIDPETDRLIQEMVRTKFDGCTILTIAHRLNTIVDYDRVMVLSAGLLAEFDNPDTLLHSVGGSFASMVDNTGKTSARHLREVARTARLKLVGTKAVEARATAVLAPLNADTDGSDSDEMSAALSAALEVELDRSNQV